MYIFEQQTGAVLIKETQERRDRKENAGKTKQAEVSKTTRVCDEDTHGAYPSVGAEMQRCRDRPGGCGRGGHSLLTIGYLFSAT